MHRRRRTGSHHLKAVGLGFPQENSIKVQTCKQSRNVNAVVEIINIFVQMVCLTKLCVLNKT